MREVPREVMGRAARVKRAGYGATCYICRRSIRRNTPIDDSAGFWAHLACAAKNRKDKGLK